MNKVQQYDNAIMDFKEHLGTREKLVEELENFAPNHGQPEQKNLVIFKLLNQLDVNLMLAFLWLGCLTSELPVLEKDILGGAQADNYGYVSAYQITWKALSQVSQRLSAKIEGGKPLQMVAMVK